MYDGVPIQAAEVGRQAAVDRADIAAVRWDVRLQRIAERAAEIAGTPIAAISVVDRARQWLAAKTGPVSDEVPRALSFCAQTIHRPGEPMVVPDASRDARFAKNPFVCVAPYIRFYIGIPLVDQAGYALGALCVVDHVPHDTVPDLYDLASLAREAERIMIRRS